LLVFYKIDEFSFYIENCVDLIAKLPDLLQFGQHSSLSFISA